MTALQVGKQVYLAPSAKGQYSLVYQDRLNSRTHYPGTGELRSSAPDEIREALQGARDSNKDTSRKNIQHRNDAACGEVMAS